MRGIKARHQRYAACEPLYDINPQTGVTIEVFHADLALAKCLGEHNAGWFFWTSRPGCCAPTEPRGPFATRYAAYRDALGGSHRQFGK